MNKNNAEFWKKFYKIRYCPSIKKEQTEWEIKFVKKFLPIEKYINVLDFICGFGRHSIELAKLGYKVEGFDIDQDSIKEANKEIKNLGLKNIKLYAQDALKFQEKDSFNAAICLYSTIGFFDEKSNKRMFRNLFESVKSKGRIILDFMNPDWAIKHLSPISKKELTYQGDKYSIRHQREILYNPIRQKNIIEFIKKKGDKKKTISYILRIYSYKELKDMLKKHNFKIHKSFGSFFKNNEISPDNQRIIIIADKK